MSFLIKTILLAVSMLVRTRACLYEYIHKYLVILFLYVSILFEFFSVLWFFFVFFPCLHVCLIIWLARCVLVVQCVHPRFCLFACLCVYLFINIHFVDSTASVPSFWTFWNIATIAGGVAAIVFVTSIIIIIVVLCKRTYVCYIYLRALWMWAFVNLCTCECLYTCLCGPLWVGHCINVPKYV